MNESDRALIRNLTRLYNREITVSQRGGGSGRVREREGGSTKRIWINGINVRGTGEEQSGEIQRKRRRRRRDKRKR